MKVKIYAEQTIYYAAEIDYGELKELAPQVPPGQLDGSGGVFIPAGEWVTAAVEEYVAASGHETDTTGITVTEITAL